MCGCLGRPEEGRDSSELELQADVSAPGGCWEPNLGLVEEEQVLLVAEPSRQPPPAHLETMKTKADE